MNTDAAFNITPDPRNYAGNETWRTMGSHLMADGSCCHCGPANHLTGPQFACECER